MTRVGVSMRVVGSDDYTEIRDAISHDWITLLLRHDITPVLLPNDPAVIHEFLDTMQVSALLLTNGNNIGPLGDDERSLQIDDVSEKRDLTEHKIIEYAVKNDLPLLGACRGMQLLNAYFGGKLLRDISEPCGSPGAHVSIDHLVKFVDRDFRDRFGVSEAVTNSFHRQAVSLSTLSDELRPFALAAGDIVEGLYHPKLPLIGIQWHPERINPAEDIDQILFSTWLNGR